MERDYDYSGAVYAEDLEPGRHRTLRGRKSRSPIKPEKADTAQVPVVYDARVARSLISHFASAVNGSSIARDTSFLKDSMGERVFGDGINIIDDPHRRRGLRSNL